MSVQKTNSIITPSMPTAEEDMELVKSIIAHIKDLIVKLGDLGLVRKGEDLFKELFIKDEVEFMKVKKYRDENKEKAKKKALKYHPKYYNH